MIDTEIYTYESWSNFICFDEVLKMVNKLIKEKEIKKMDIVEYRTENWRIRKRRTYTNKAMIRKIVSDL